MDLCPASKKSAISIPYVKIGTQCVSTRLSMVRSSERPSILNIAFVELPNAFCDRAFKRLRTDETET